MGTDQDKLVGMGSAGSEINSILSSVSTVMKTMALVTSIVNGGSSGGLLGVSNTSATNRTSEFSQYQSTGFLGVTASSTVSAAGGALAISPTIMANNISKYQAAWNLITSAANTASTTVTDLANTCAAQSSAAQTALTTEVAPVLAQVSTASMNIANANALLQQIQNDPTTDPSGTAYANDMATLQTISPTASDVSSAQQNSQVTGTIATTTDPNSLSVSGGSTVDQMNFIATQAVSLKAACGP